VSQRVFRRGGSCLLEVLIAATLVALGVLAVLRAWLVARDQARHAHTRAVLSSLNASLTVYRCEWGCTPPGSNADMVVVLTTRGSMGICFSMTGKKVNDKGELLDAWGTPFMYVGDSKRQTKRWRLYSFGPNQKDDLGEGDDVTVR